MKAEALQDQTTASRPIKALTVYPPNTPATLVPRVLPTKSQVKINIFALIQLFWNLRKPVKRESHRRVSLKGKRALNKSMNAISPRKYDEIERKNLLIANDNLIADCLSKEVFYIASNSELTVSRFTEMPMPPLLFQSTLSGLLKQSFKLKYQHLKESFGNNKSLPAQDAPDFDSVFNIEKNEAYHSRKGQHS
ncbi:hypothetical protein Tco_1285972 [Tanacetum coccineum]